MEPFFLAYLLIPLGYTSALAALSASAERALERGYPEKAVKLLNWARKAPFLATYRSMCEVNLITAAYAIENFALVDEVWASLRPRLASLKPYTASALASYGATLIGRGRYTEALEVLTDPIGVPEPNAPIDDIAALCSAFCRTNQASAYISLGRHEEAAHLLSELSPQARMQPMFFTLTSYLKAILFYLQGDPEQCSNLTRSLNISSLPFLYQGELYFHFATILARCGDPDGASLAIARVHWETSGHRKLTRLRVLAQAELAAAQGQNERAESYFKDLLSLGHVDALSYLRASAISKKLGHDDASRMFLDGAIQLDPESHWAHVAQGRLAHDVAAITFPDSPLISEPTPTPPTPPLQPPPLKPEDFE